jgi:hypothetical protein
MLQSAFLFHLPVFEPSPQVERSEIPLKFSGGRILTAYQINLMGYQYFSVLDSEQAIKCPVY